MNSKFAPGVVCQIVGIHWALEELRGRFVTLVEPLEQKGMRAWRLDRRIDFVTSGSGIALSGERFVAGEKVWVDALQERFLRPLDNPPDDAVSQEVRPLPECWVIDAEVREL